MISGKSTALIIAFCLAFSLLTACDTTAADQKLIVLCYHAVLPEPDRNDPYTISRYVFVKQMEYLKTHGYNPVSLDDMLRAKKGEKPLPPKPVLLMFDDGYVSYREFILPVLEKYGYPSVLAVVGNFVGYKPKGLPEPVMTWQQIREVSKHRLVEIASHSYDLHRSIRYTPQGNVAAAANVKLYNEEKKTIESKEEYRKRIEEDFLKQQQVFEKELGYRPRAMVWPYGKYSQPAVEAAEKFGYQFAFTLENGYSGLDDLMHIKRNMVINEPVDEFLKSLKAEFDPLKEFIKMVKNPLYDKKLIRAAQVDLDLVYDPDPAQIEKNLGRLIDRLVVMRVNTVFLQAFADPDGTGNIRSVYFPNRVLPVRADIFSYAAHQISIREIQVYAWMPTLSIELPDKKLNDSLRVRAYSKGSTGLSTSWYNRLSPFNSITLKTIRMLYEDLASNSQIDGILFQDDAYLNDFEDFHPEAAEQFRKKFNRQLSYESVRQDAGFFKKWTEFKTWTIISFLDELKKTVRYWRPEARFARNMYAEVLLNPSAEEWYAQNYELFLRHYDFVALMAYPQMEKADNPVKWLASIVNKVKKHNGIDKTIFKIQTYDWDKKEWLDNNLLRRELRAILQSGGLHLAYYPDDYTIDKPGLNIIKLEMSTKTFPFLP
ncbi:MAG: poly-beta-1,6-N-acetyl-D-glucosamine N-deacetylase PgaB [Nitrospiraceae bacterium]|nr:poly-beta-1,6-N-acetyl-D-glucosamine N-deacetylase PgaB [Nitrospiraceae bacterium]